jgi:hypothetical protein
VALVVLGLCALAIAVYWPARHAGFVNFDDDEYVAGNPRCGRADGDGASWPSVPR